MEEGQEEVISAPEQKQFTFHFDYYHKTEHTFLKRTTNSMMADSWENCMFSLAKVAIKILMTYKNEPWRIVVSTACRPEDTVSHKLK